MYLSLKKDDRLQDISKYGGYSDIRGAFFFLVEHTKSKKRIRSIEMFPLHLLSKFYEDKNTVLDYAIKVLHLQDPKILIDKINYRTEIIIDNFSYLISTKSNDGSITVKPNEQMYWRVDEISNLKKIENKYKKEALLTEEDRKIMESYIDKIYQQFKAGKYKNRRTTDTIIEKYEIIDLETLDNNQLYQLLIAFISLSYKTSNNAVDFTVIGLGSECGKPRITNLPDNTYLVYKSITGIYEKRIRIK